MTQTPEGAKKAAKTLKERRGEDYFNELGRKGGKKTSQRGKNPFFDREYARDMGRKTANE